MGVIFATFILRKPIARLRHFIKKADFTRATSAPSLVFSEAKRGSEDLPKNYFTEYTESMHESL
jgi:hypothetical protein